MHIADLTANIELKTRLYLSGNIRFFLLINYNNIINTARNNLETKWGIHYADFDKLDFLTKICYLLI